MMRLLLIFCLCGVVLTQEQAAVENIEENVDSLPVEDVAVEDEFDVGRALEELLIEEDEMVEDVEAMEAEKAIAPVADDAEVTPEVTEQFNRLTDVIISKVNVALRTKKLDPLSLNFQKNKKGKKKRKSKKRKSKKRKQKKRKNKKNRKTRDVTNIEEEDDVMEIEEEEDDAEAVIYSINDEDDEEEEDEEEEEDDLERVRRAVDDEEDEADEEVEGDGRKFNGKGKRKGGKKGKKSKGKKGKKSKKSKKKRSRKKRRASSIVGVLSGLSTLKRSGDVVVQGEPGNSDIVADFTAGPVNLIAIRKLGKGKKQRRSKATVNTLKGRMVINFSEGASQINDIILYRPDIIDVDGALSKGKKKQTDAQMMKKVRQVNPIVATKLKQVTRDVLQTIRIQ